MSINHYSSTELSETQLWSHYVMESTAKTSSSHHQYHHNPFISTHHLQIPSSTATFCLTSPHGHTTGGGGGRMFNAGFSFNLNNEDEEELAADEQLTEERESSSNHCHNGGNPREVSEQDEIPKEPLFEKPLTPSDVGKLNRLVIPKQHAEKHFPLNGGGAAAAESGENGLLLSFEDEVGKSWRFRYSYWNSSQSYVLTKGWSRFVKEKRLDAGDIVVFSRRRGDAGRLFIGWRRRNSNIGGSQSTAAVVRGGGGGGGGWNRQMFYSGQQYPYQTQNQAGPHSLSYQPESCLHAGSIVQNQTPSSASSTGNSKTTLRLFGVNLECQSEPSTPVGSPMSGQAQAQAHYYHQYYSNNHMDISFSGGDAYRQG